MIQASPFQLAQKTIPKIIMAAVAAFPPATVLADRTVPAAVDGLAILMKAPWRRKVEYSSETEHRREGAQWDASTH